jgi:hypothetical protein
VERQQQQQRQDEVDRSFQLGHVQRQHQRRQRQDPGDPAPLRPIDAPSGRVVPALVNRIHQQDAQAVGQQQHAEQVRRFLPEDELAQRKVRGDDDAGDERGYETDQGRESQQVARAA